MTDLSKIKDIKDDDFSIKKITDKCILVKLMRRKLNNSKIDDDITKVLNRKYKTKNYGDLRANKSLFPKQCVSKYSKLLNEASIYFYTMTTPWEDSGYRLLHIRNYHEFNNKMRDFIQRFESSVETFIEGYENNIDQAQEALGNAFNRSDYPTKGELETKYELTVKFSAIPDTNDIRLSLPQDELDAIKENIETGIQEKIKKTTVDLYDRLQKQIIYTRNILEKTKQNQRTKFRDTLISNIADLCDLIPNLNITNDEDLNDLAQQIKKTMSQYDPADLRDDPMLRKDAVDTADQIVSKMQGVI